MSPESREKGHANRVPRASRESSKTSLTNFRTVPLPSFSLFLAFTITPSHLSSHLGLFWVPLFSFFPLARRDKKSILYRWMPEANSVYPRGNAWPDGTKLFFDGRSQDFMSLIKMAPCNRAAGAAPRRRSWVPRRRRRFGDLIEDEWLTGTRDANFSFKQKSQFSRNPVCVDLPGFLLRPFFPRLFLRDRPCRGSAGPLVARGFLEVVHEGVGESKCNMILFVFFFFGLRTNDYTQ